MKKLTKKRLLSVLRAQFLFKDTHLIPERRYQYYEQFVSYVFGSDKIINPSAIENELPEAERFYMPRQTRGTCSFRAVLYPLMFRFVNIYKGKKQDILAWYDVVRLRELGRVMDSMKTIEDRGNAFYSLLLLIKVKHDKYSNRIHRYIDIKSEAHSIANNLIKINGEVYTSLEHQYYDEYIQRCELINIHSNKTDDPLRLPSVHFEIREANKQPNGFDGIQKIINQLYSSISTDISGLDKTPEGILRIDLLGRVMMKITQLGSLTDNNTFMMHRKITMIRLLLREVYYKIKDMNLSILPNMRVPDVVEDALYNFRMLGPVESRKLGDIMRMIVGVQSVYAEYFTGVGLHHIDYTNSIEPLYEVYCSYLVYRIMEDNKLLLHTIPSEQHHDKKLYDLTHCSGFDLGEADDLNSAFETLADHLILTDITDLGRYQYTANRNWYEYISIIPTDPDILQAHLAYYNNKTHSIVSTDTLPLPHRKDYFDYKFYIFSCIWHDESKYHNGLGLESMIPLQYYRTLFRSMEVLQYSFLSHHGRIMYKPDKIVMIPESFSSIGHDTKNLKIMYYWSDTSQHIPPRKQLQNGTIGNIHFFESLSYVTDYKQLAGNDDRVIASLSYFSGSKSTLKTEGDPIEDAGSSTRR